MSMSLCANSLIEKYADMIEKSDLLNAQDMAERTIDIIFMLSEEPALSHTMDKINAQLQQIIFEAKELKIDSALSGLSSKKIAAQKIRALKQVEIWH